MSGFFYNLGKKAGPHLRKANWICQSLTGTEANALEAEYQAGLGLAEEFKRQLPPDPDRSSAQILNKIGERLSACVTNKLRKFNFEVVLAPKPNAFALPGGFIFVSRPILELCQWDQNQIACILAHEMGHVIGQHAMDRIIARSAISITARTFRTQGLLAGWLHKAGIQSLQCAYSQDQESEADELAVRLAKAAGYDPKAAIELFTRLGELTKSSESDTFGEYFSTHPSFKLRIENIKKALKKISPESESEK